MTVREAVVDEKTLQTLGEDELRDVCACLWAVDCQTCGGFLGDDPPALVVDDSMVFATATLHHSRCRPAQWNDTGLVLRASGDYVSFLTRTVILPLATGGDGDVEFWPMVLVNPGLECVTLRRDQAGRWRLQPDTEFSAAGLVALGLALVHRTPLEGVIARVMAGSVAVTFQTVPLGTYEVPADEGYLECVRERDGVLVGVTHAVNPGEFTREDLQAAMEGPQMLAGWVGLDGQATPGRQRNVAGLGVTCVLHWNERHMSVGALIGRAPKLLGSRRAQSWAQGVIGADGHALLPWKLVDGNQPSGGWYTINALSGKQYFLRRHSDGWKLVQAYSWVDGKTVETDNEAKAWAAGVLQFRAGISGLNWEPGPSTPGSETLYASA